MESRSLFRSIIHSETTDIIVKYVFPELWLLWRSFESARLRRRRLPAVATAHQNSQKSWQNSLQRKAEIHNGTDSSREVAVGWAFGHKVYTPEDLERDLSGIVGLEHVKESIRDIYFTIRTNQERKLRGLQTTQQSLHMVFLGNPGTGKTTVARLMGEMFRRMGVLSKGHFVETDPTGLIAEHLGQTGPKTFKKIKEAMGGVLFIDEAYALIDMERPDINTFGKEAISVLIKAMEDYRENLCVIYAGYKEEMEAFLDINPGMKSRIPFVIEFEDYRPEELVQIFCLECSKRQYRITPEGEAYLLDLFDRNLGNMRTLGNGRFARNVLEAAITQQARRLGSMTTVASTEDLLVLAVEDLRAWELKRG
ncbi:AAA family ATPase [Effusibacillus pohliae]|uniref:AAA family ATPase n=1 Tax=Effusibacillus pohliae TaxID=232270 RepID=UPI00037A677F|nr:AAA family ATPase [Effusibacillus pohliae]